MIWHISWRNVWRNRLRSMVVVSAIAIGLTSTIFTIAFMNGLGEQAVHSTIAYETSAIQFHHPSFSQNEEVRFTIMNATALLSDLMSRPGVKAACRRSKIIAMASTAASGSGVMTHGIYPDEEKKVTRLWQRILHGSYFDVQKRNPCVIGEKLASKLEVKLNAKIVLTMQTIDGMLTGGAFRVVGIFKTDNSLFDETTVFVDNEDLIRLINFPADQSHEIAVKLQDSHRAEITAQRWRDEFTNLEIKTWRDLRPDIGMMEGMMQQMMFLFLIVILAAMAFGIINTMLMAVVERIRELGMLMAIGMSKIRIFTMILLETVFLSLCGGLVGMTLSGIIIFYFGIKGINLSALAEGLSALGYATMIYPSISLPFFVMTTLLIILTGVLSSIYPARKALKFNPAQAIRMD